MLALRREAGAAPAGLWRLIRGDRSWDGAFRFTSGSFVRSFCGPLLALPFYLLAVAVVDRSGLEPDGAGLASAAAAHLLDAFGFPLILAAIAGPLRVKGGYLAFLVVDNWASLYLNILLLASSLLTLLGPDGAVVFSWASLLLLCLSVVLTWRIGRETLTREIAPLALVVVLDVAWGAVAEAIARRLLG